MLADLLNWDEIMLAPRHAGGHSLIMECLFKGATVVASWIEDDYQGYEAFVYRLEDGRYVLLTDSFGSCSGCDSWEDASDAEAKALCNSLANDAHAFATIEEAIDFIENKVPEDTAAYYHERHLVNVLEQLKAQASQP